MPNYRCYFLDPQDRIQAAENIEAPGFDEAVDTGLSILRARRHPGSIELWQGALRLYASRSPFPRHQCVIYEGAPLKLLPGLAAVIAKNLKENRRCLYLNSAPMVAGIKLALSAGHVEVEHELGKGSLVLSSGQEHLAGSGFDPDQMLGMLEQAVDEAMRDGYCGLWASGDMTWELGPERDAEKVRAYEDRLEKIFRRRPALSGICQYHADTLPKEITRVGQTTHPAIFVNETLSRLNPHYQELPAL